MTGSSRAQSDARLLRRVAARDAAACRTLVDRHLATLVGFAQRMLGDAAAAEDVAQEAFLRLWRQAGSWRAEAAIATWLHRVAHNLCIDQLRRRREVIGGAVPEIADPAEGPQAAHQRRQVAAIVDAAIADLPDRQRAAITLVHHLEFGNIAAAEVMDITVEALESLLARGRRALRERLADERLDLMGDV